MNLPEVKEFRRPMGRPEDWTTEGFLDELRHRYSAKTDYALHKLLRVSRQSIYRYRDRKGTFDEDVALRVAELLNLDPQMMLTWVVRERSRHAQAKKHWTQLLARLGGTAAAVLLAFMLAPALPDLTTAAATVERLCIM